MSGRFPAAHHSQFQAAESLVEQVRYLAGRGQVTARRAEDRIYDSLVGGVAFDHASDPPTAWGVPRRDGLEHPLRVVDQQPSVISAVRETRSVRRILWERPLVRWMAVRPFVDHVIAGLSVGSQSGERRRVPVGHAEAGHAFVACGEEVNGFSG